MYSIEDLKQLISAFDKSSASSLKITDSKGEKISLKKAPSVAINAIPENLQPAIAQTPVLTSAPAYKAEVSQPQALQESGRVIKSPMVGVFYSAPSPDSAPFVSAGSAVKKGDVICIIEAMKLMNEISAEEDGILSEVLVSNGQIVEFGQPLFRIG